MLGVVSPISFTLIIINIELKIPPFGTPLLLDVLKFMFKMSSLIFLISTYCCVLNMYMSTQLNHIPSIPTISSWYNNISLPTKTKFRSIRPSIAWYLQFRTSFSMNCIIASLVVFFWKESNKTVIEAHTWKNFPRIFEK